MTIQATNATISKIIGDNSHTVVAGESPPLIYGQRRAFLIKGFVSRPAIAHSGEKIPAGDPFYRDSPRHSESGQYRAISRPRSPAGQPPASARLGGLSQCQNPQAFESVDSGSNSGRVSGSTGAGVTAGSGAGVRCAASVVSRASHKMLSRVLSG